MILLIASVLYLLIVGPILFAGLKVLKPNEALVLTLFGIYYGTLKGEGFFFVNPFTVAVNPALPATSSEKIVAETLISQDKSAAQAAALNARGKKISLKT